MRSIQIAISSLTIVLIAAGPVRAGEGEDALSAMGRYEAAVARTRSLCRTVLVTLKEIQKAAPPDRAANEAVVRTQGANRLASLEPILAAFDERARDASDERKKATSAIDAAVRKGIDPGDLADRLSATNAHLDAFRAHVDRFVGEARAHYGVPAATAAPGTRAGGALAPPSSSNQVSAPSNDRYGGGPRLEGELSLGIGSDRYERPNVDEASRIPRDESASRLDAQLRASTELSTGTLLHARYSRTRQVERREVTLSDVGAGFGHRLGAVRLSADFARQGYDDAFAEDVVEDASYDENRLRGGAELDLEAASLGVEYDSRSRAHADDEDRADPTRRDYDISSTRVYTRLGERSGVFGSYTTTSRDAANEITSHDQTRIRAGITMTPRARLTYEREKLEPRKDDMGFSIRPETERTKVELATGSTVLEYHQYAFPDLDEADYADAGISSRTRGTTGWGDSRRSSSKRIRAFYRKHDSDDAFDFVSFTRRQTTRPLGSGSYRTLGLTIKAFLEKADFDSLGELSDAPTSAEVFAALGLVTAAFQETREAHRIDVFTDLGWVVRRSEGPVRSIEFGPTLGHIMYVDTERNRLSDISEDLIGELPDDQEIDDPFGGTDWLFRNPINRGRVGGKAAIEMSGERYRGRLGVRYDVQLLYNAEPTDTFTSWEVDFHGSTFVHPQVTLDARARVHRARFGDDSPNDLDTSEVRIGARYVFDLGRE